MLINKTSSHASAPGSQQGVVLIVVLIILLITSVVTSVSIRGASSSEQISNQTRLRTLSQQSAEAALRFCEGEVQKNALDGTQGFLPQNAPAGSPLTYTWENMDNWDAIDSAKNSFVATGHLKVVEFKATSDNGSNSIYFRRQPECMSQFLSVGNTKTFVTTARGFGPEVGEKDGNAPKGTEIWLQSVVTMK